MRGLLLGILALALLLRVMNLVWLTHEPEYAAPLADAAFHDYWARALATGDWTPPEGADDPHLQTTPFLRPPGYPYFLAGVYASLGTGPLGIRVVQLGLGLLSVWLAYLLARRIYDAPAGLVAALLMATCWALIFYEGDLLEPPLLVPLLLLVALVLHAWSQRGGWWRALLAGALLGLLALVRPNALLLVPALAVWMLWCCVRDGGWRRALVPGFALVGGALVALAPATIRNYVVARDFVPISANGAINLYIGNNPEADGYTPRVPELDRLTDMTGWSWFHYGRLVKALSEDAGRPLSYLEVDQHFSRLAWEWIRAHPVRCAQLVGKRLLLLLGPVEVSNNRVTHYDRWHAPLLGVLPGFPLILAATLLALLVLGLARPDATRTSAAASGTVLLLLIAAVYVGSYLPFLAAERFRVPAYPLLIIVGAAGLRHLWMLGQQRDWRSLVLWGGVTLALYGVAQMRLVPYVPERGLWYTTRGVTFARLGQTEQAIAAYQAAVAAEPTFATPLRRLALLLDEQGRDAEALTAYQRLVTLAPDDADAYYRLGGVLLRQQRAGEAVAAYQRAVQLDPRLDDAQVNLGIALSRGGEHAQALVAYAAALRLQPSHAVAHYNAGLSHAALGDLAAAQAAYRRAQACDPLLVEATINLGQTLINARQFEQAATELRKATQQAPTRFEAWYNLGLALLGQGQTGEARAAFNEALRLRPGQPEVLKVLEQLGASTPTGSPSP